MAPAGLDNAQVWFLQEVRDGLPQKFRWWLKIGVENGYIVAGDVGVGGGQRAGFVALAVVAVVKLNIDALGLKMSNEVRGLLGGVVGGVVEYLDLQAVGWNQKYLCGFEYTGPSR